MNPTLLWPVAELPQGMSAAWLSATALDEHGDRTVRGTLVMVRPDPATLARLDFLDGQPVLLWLDDCGGLSPLREEDEPALSFEDPETRDRIERWGDLAELLGAAPGQRVIFAGLRERSGPVALFHLLDARGPVSVSIRVPALAEIDPAAPDADWLALAAVCRAVGGAS